MSASLSMPRPVKKAALFLLVAALVFPTLQNIVVASTGLVNHGCAMSRISHSPDIDQVAHNDRSGSEWEHAPGGTIPVDDAGVATHCASCALSLYIHVVPSGSLRTLPRSPNVADQYPSHHHAPIFRPPRV